MQRFGPSRRLRARVVLACGFVGGLLAGCEVGRTPTDIVSLADALGAAAHGVASPSDVRWEPSSGWLLDFVYGRWVLFLSSDAPRGPRDVWRARVRLSPEGGPLEVAEAHNLTSTPLGDDHSLIVRHEHAAFATVAYGQEQSVSLLDLSGEPSSAATPTDHVTGWLTNLQQTGTGAGIGRVDVTLEQPASNVGLVLGDRALSIDLADNAHASRRHAALDYASGDLVPAEGVGDVRGMHAEAARHLPKRLTLWAVDTVRAVPWIGPAPVAWLEERVFAARDAVNQLVFKLEGGASDELADSSGGSSGAAMRSVAAPGAPIPVADLTEGRLDAAHWPPPNVPSIWKTAEPGEGQWQAPKLSWLKKLEVPGVDRSVVPPAMLRTFVRPDPDRPYTRVILVAMDMRQLDLDMEAGTEDPKPLTGGHGLGRIPRDPGLLPRVVAAFNGAFKTEHGNYGMMVHKRVLLPPQPNAASVVVLADRRVGFGTWPNTREVGGIQGVADGDIVSFRQNLDALVDGDEVNPMGRALWGYTLPGSGMQTERSGLCVTSAGHLMYAWGDDVSGSALGKAMKMAGCLYAMHLDMNPHHTGFIFASMGENTARSYHSELLSPLMTVSPDRYIEYAPKDFFYVVLHDPSPPALTAGAAWRPDSGTQPTPSWIPALYVAKTEASCVPGGSGDCEDAGASVELLDVEPGRATWRIRAGTAEPDPKTGAVPLHELAVDDARGVLLSVGMGVSPEKRPRGLATDGRMVFPIAASGESRDGAGVGLLVAEADGSLAILRTDELGSVAPHVDLVELPLLLDNGTVEPEAKTVGLNVLRGAIGTTPEGRVLIARGTFGSDAPLAEALRRARCVRAVALDRGSHAQAFLHRAGSGNVPRSRYEETVLYGLAAPLKPRGFRFEAQTAVADASHAR